MIKKIKIDEEWVETAVLGGAILGGGGGGDPEGGKKFGRIALEFGNPTVLDLDQLPEDSLILTVSAVGAPSALNDIKPAHYVRAVEVIMENLDQKIRGLMTNEIGGMAVVNGLLQSAALSIPLIDAACNGRAHPTGGMGSMGLTMKEDFISHQAAVSGKVEIYVKGALSTASKLVRKAAEESGVVAAARNPVPAAYVRENAAVGALSQAVRLGRIFLEGKTAKEKVKRVVEALKGEMITQGDVESVELKTQQGFDLGTVRIDGFELTFWNEYMTLEKKGKRIATFPDLIVTMDSQTGLPAGTAKIREGQNVVVITTSSSNLILGGGMKDPKLFCEVEEVIGKEMVRYVFPKG
jgi:hypothetical protein